MSGNIFGVKKWDHFVKEFRELIAVIMNFEPTLVVIPYQDGTESHKGRLFAHEATTVVARQG